VIRKFVTVQSSSQQSQPPLQRSFADADEAADGGGGGRGTKMGTSAGQALALTFFESHAWADCIDDA
jgi:hypothetical protein|tara:strand:+ start:417 stop:617 length:201 start_codon:yes stop_codon:yes gene_type:complete